MVEREGKLKGGESEATFLRRERKKGRRKEKGRQVQACVAGLQREREIERDFVKGKYVSIAVHRFQLSRQSLSYSIGYLAWQEAGSQKNLLAE